MPRLSAMIACVGVSASCALFGQTEIPCEGDPECPAGQHCGAEGICVAGARPVDAGSGVDAGTGSDAAGTDVSGVDAASGDDSGAQPDASGGDGGVVEPCQSTRCAPMPDSPTSFCRTSYDGDDPCPPEGEVYYGQDGSYLIEPLVFVEGAGGVVEEQVTGLMWQQVAAQQERSQADAIAYCDALSLGGHDDWRLPELRELLSLVDYGQTAPAHRLDAIAFPAPENEPYWSASSYRTSSHEDQVWVIDLWTGDVDGAEPDLGLVDTFAVRCVRGAQTTIGHLAFSNGAWTDASTGLVWQGTDEAELDWAEALVFCEELDLGGQADWRLPSVKELETLIDRSYDGYFDEVAVHEALRTSTAMASYWSSTPITHQYGAWTISMATGNYSWNNYSGFIYTRCVRGP